MSPRVGRWDERSAEEMRRGKKKKSQPSGVVTDRGWSGDAGGADGGRQNKGGRKALYNCILI